ncbi:MAG: sensor histidine kinase [Rhodoferax sp.]|nr:MAG: sensor histidine kinase [Rhodoferax sp.]
MTTAERDLGNLTRVGQEHANRTFRSADQVIQFVRAQYLEKGNKLNLEALSAQGVIDTEIFNQVGVIDANGIYVLANRPINGRLDLSDREHFRVHVAADTGELFVSKPVVGRATGKWSIQLTRRINGPKGEFMGVVVVSVDPSYFTRFYGDLELGEQGMAALYGLDGIARARRVGQTEDFGARAKNATMFERIAAGTPTGSYVSASVVDGVERMYYFRKIPGYTLAVVAGIEMRFLLANHDHARNALFLEAILLTVLILLLAWALVRYLKRLRTETAARMRAQEQVQDRTEQLNAIFSLSPDGFVSFDAKRRVKYVNPAFLRMTVTQADKLQGLSEQEFSQWLSALCDPNTPFKGVDKLRLQEGREKDGSREIIEVDSFGKRVLQVRFRRSDTESVSQILYFRDVTHENVVDQMKSEFLSTAAHELRTPMASIYGFTELLLHQEHDRETEKEFLGIVYRQSELMVRIIDELLDLARIEARKGKDFVLSDVDMQDLLTDLARTYVPPPGRAVPHLEMPSASLRVRADAGKLRQALLNVLVNAYKFSAAGGEVEITLEPIMDQGSEEVSSVAVVISDTGIGMTPEQLQQVCNRFYRADSSGKVPGTGLGMAIVKEIVELHHGEIHIASQWGKGTEVRLTFPVISDGR